MRHTPARYKLIFAMYPMSDYPRWQVELAMTVVAHLRRGELWLVQAPTDEDAKP